MKLIKWSIFFMLDWSKENNIYKMVIKIMDGSQIVNINVSINLKEKLQKEIIWLWLWKENGNHNQIEYYGLFN